MDRETRDRGILVFVGLTFAAAILLGAGCPKPVPPPVTPPDASDAARPRPAPSCATACSHSETICAGSGDVCLMACNRIGSNDPGYAPCVLAAKKCGDLKGCDPLAR